MIKTTICLLALTFGAVEAGCQTIEFEPALQKTPSAVVKMETVRFVQPGHIDTTVAVRLDTITTTRPAANPTGMFKTGGVELMSTAMQATAQVLKLTIGEGRVSIPFFFYMGATASAFKADAPRAALAALLNPLGGNFNFKSTGTRTLWNTGERTFFRFNYNLGVKQLTSSDNAGKGVPLTLGTAEGGFRFETKAALEQRGAGIAYLQVLAGGIQGSDLANLKKLFGKDVNRRFGTLTVDGGVEITDILVAKFSLYDVLSGNKASAMKKPVFKFGFDYKPAK